MVVEKTQEIKEIEYLKSKGKYYEALEKIEALLKKKDASEIEKIQTKIEKSMILDSLGLFENSREKWEEGLTISTEIQKESEKLGKTVLIYDSFLWNLVLKVRLGKREEFLDGVNRLEELYFKLEKENYANLNEKFANLSSLKAAVGYVKAVLFEDYKRDTNETIEILEKGIKRARDSDNKEILFWLYTQLGNVYENMGDYDKAFEYAQKLLKESEELGNEYWKAFALSTIGNIYWVKGEYDSLLEYAKKSLEIRKEIGNKRFLAPGYNLIGIYYAMIMELKESSEYFKKAYDIHSENVKKEDDAHFLNNLASVYNKLGEVDKSLELFEKLNAIQKKQGNISGSYLSLLNIAGILSNKGDLEQALEIYNQVLDFYSRIGDKYRTAWIQKFIGKIYEKKGAFNTSIDYLEKALETNLELGNKDSIAGTFYDFILLSTKYDRMDLAKEYYKKLEEIIEEIEYKNIKRMVLIAEGIILMRSKESRDRDRAEVLFDQLLQEDLGPFLSMEVLLQSSELLLTELKETSNERYLSKLQKNINKLIEIGTKNNFSHVIVESLWFKSQLSLLDFDVDKARELLTQALDIAERKGLNRLALKIANAKEQLIKQKIELDEFEKTSPTIAKRMEIIKVENGFKELKQKEAFELSIEKIESSGKLLSLKI